MNVEFKAILEVMKDRLDFAAAHDGGHSTQKAAALDAAIEAFGLSEKLLAIGESIGHAGKIERAERFLDLTHDIAQDLMDQGIYTKASTHLPTDWDLY